MDISRRWFIGGAAAFGACGALAGNRLFASSAFKAGGRPNLTFGVISDLHLTHTPKKGEGIAGVGNDLTVRRALEWFRDQGVDAVVMPGDLTDHGTADQLEILAKAWFDVFPENRAPDGRLVEKVFVYGNHDFHGHLLYDYVKKNFSSEEEFRRNSLRADMAGWWKKLFHEDYSRIYRKDVNGYAFIGGHWDDGTGLENGWGRCLSDVGVAEYLAAKGKTLDPSRPFFFVQHPHPRNTCYGPWAWGHDTGASTKALAAFPNAIAFSGHSHYTLTDERSVWQGAFTSIGAGALRRTGLPEDEVGDVGFENGVTEGRNARKLNAVKLMPRMTTTDSRQGMLCRVYDDCMVIRRREFLSEMDLGADWVLPLPAAESSPFAFAERAKAIGAPEFPEGAALSAHTVTAKNRGAGARGSEPAIPSVPTEAVEIRIPAAIARDGARVFRFEVVLTPKAGGAAVTHYVLAEGFNQGVRHPKATGETRCVLAWKDLPEGEVVCRVTPQNCYGRPGRPLSLALAREP